MPKDTWVPADSLPILSMPRGPHLLGVLACACDFLERLERPRHRRVHLRKDLTQVVFPNGRALLYQGLLVCLRVCLLTGVPWLFVVLEQRKKFIQSRGVRVADTDAPQNRDAPHPMWIN